MRERLIATVVKPGEVDADFTRDLQGIALRAWTAALASSRRPDEIQRAFNPDNPSLVAAAQQQYSQFAKHGRLVIVHTADFSPVTLGYAMVRNDVSPKSGGLPQLYKRSVKRVLAGLHNYLHVPTPQSVYAWEKHVTAEPDAPPGVGTLAVKKSLQAGFYPDQISTAYIDDENESSIAFFHGLGYRWDEDMGNVKQVFRFGEENDPTTQRRYIAPVQTVLSQATVRLIQLEG